MIFRRTLKLPQEELEAGLQRIYAAQREEAATLLVGEGEENFLVVDDRSASINAPLPPGVIDILGPTSRPRSTSWHLPCPICAKEFRSTDVIRNVLLSDGSRPYVHAHHLSTDPKGTLFMSDDRCKHDITPASACTWCNGTEMPIYPRSRSFRARRTGTCIVCKGAIAKQTLIMRVSCRDGVGYAHGFHRS